MTKIVIISYFFPPSNFVGGERTAAWAKHLNEFGIYPIVVTRQWNNNQKDLVDPLHENQLTIEKTDTYEIHRLPYKRTLRDRVSSVPMLKVFQKLLTLKELIFSNFFLSALPYSNFYRESKKIIESENVKAVIASGRPFQSFFIGYQLKKKYDLLWIPDYRDEWTTHKHTEGLSGIWKWINKLERKSELKWTSNADFFITVSDNWTNRIKELISKEGKVVLNGYNKLIEQPVRKIDPEKLIITYAGTLYPSQDIEVFINAAIELIEENNEILIRFIGVEMMPSELNRVQSLTKGYEVNFEFIDRVPSNELTIYLNESDLLILTSFKNINGWYPVKLFEYYASGIPIILCPSDNDCMDNFISSTNSGFIANTIQECKATLAECIKKKKVEGKVQLNRNLEFGSVYSRKNQTAVLAKFIDEALNK